MLVKWALLKKTVGQIQRFFILEGGYPAAPQLPKGALPIQKPLQIGVPPHSKILSAATVCLKDYTMKCELLIGGICFTRIFVFDCVARQTGLYACTISIYDNDHFHFLEHFESVSKNGYFSKMTTVYPTGLSHNRFCCIHCAFHNSFMVSFSSLLGLCYFEVSFMERYSYFFMCLLCMMIQ